MADPLDRYKEFYVEIHGPGDQRPTALKIIDDEGLVNKWTDKVVLVTGGTSAVGLETARALHATGAHIYITARDTKKADAAVEHILKNSVGKGPVDVIYMDMTSLDSVKKAAADFLAKSDKLNVLVCNAGIMGTPKLQTADGFEMQFGVNHLAHFTLTALLLPALLRSSTPAFNSRVVAVSSSSHRYSSVHLDDVNLTASYDPYLAYGQSKTANIWMALRLERLYGGRGVHALSLHPGGIWSGLQKYADPVLVEQWKEDQETMVLMMTPEQGAATSVWAAAAAAWEGKGGKYLTNCSVAPPAESMTSALEVGYAPHAYDEEGAAKLWELSEKLTGVSAPE
ncbi:Short chain dehydrogenase family protein [Pleurostoma richardsiae]|uniref:Short chain dehydrogenase family protein n=1 Tax=Pleurostoma richardsiae TaxID=41990 RepID=A0AA38S2I3_9PEZI|nr:Short chain dehydrogenase family protein [Pleurostoma richardsiae]